MLRTTPTTVHVGRAMRRAIITARRRCPAVCNRASRLPVLYFYVQVRQGDITILSQCRAANPHSLLVHHRLHLRRTCQARGIPCEGAGTPTRSNPPKGSSAGLQRLLAHHAGLLVLSQAVSRQLGPRQCNYHTVNDVILCPFHVCRTPSLGGLAHGTAGHEDGVQISMLHEHGHLHEFPACTSMALSAFAQMLHMDMGRHPCAPRTLHGQGGLLAALTSSRRRSHPRRPAGG